MDMVFVDTWAWLALALRRDEHHEAAKRIHIELTAAGRLNVTTDYVLSEPITNLFRVLPFDQASAFVSAVLSGVQSQRYRLEGVSPNRFEAAWRLRCKYADKPGVSFTDFTSFEVMRELGIQDVFSRDAHFAQVNLGFRLLA
jgi:predicted nucleic acid-binding protein